MAGLMRREPDGEAADVFNRDKDGVLKVRIPARTQARTGQEDSHQQVLTEAVALAPLEAQPGAQPPAGAAMSQAPAQAW
jgi:hypothetical protein